MYFRISSLQWWSFSVYADTLNVMASTYRLIRVALWCDCDCPVQIELGVIYTLKIFRVWCKYWRYLQSCHVQRAWLLTRTILHTVSTLFELHSWIEPHPVKNIIEPQSKPVKRLSEIMGVIHRLATCLMLYNRYQRADNGHIGTCRQWQHRYNAYIGYTKS